MFSYEDWNDMQREMWGDPTERFIKCDGCGKQVANPVEVRTRRPSDPTDLCCIMVGCQLCFGTAQQPDKWADAVPSVMRPQQWDEWVEQYGLANGIVWLT